MAVSFTRFRYQHLAFLSTYWFLLVAVALAVYTFDVDNSGILE